MNEQYQSRDNSSSQIQQNISRITQSDPEVLDIDLNAQPENYCDVSIEKEFKYNPKQGTELFNQQNHTIDEINFGLSKTFSEDLEVAQVNRQKFEDYESNEDPPNQTYDDIR